MKNINIPKPLTPKQKKVFDFIKTYFDDNNFSPTLNEIKDFIGAKSIRTVTQYLEKLETRELIARNKNKTRNIEILGSDKESVLINIPVVISAGCDNKNIFADENYDEYISVDKNIVGKRQVVAVRAVGSSMQDAGIDSSDYVLVEKADKPDNNEVVLAVVDGMAVIKRLNYSSNSIVLNPEPINKKYKPIVIKEENVKICGRVLDIIKNPANYIQEEIQYIDIPIDQQ